MKKHTFTLLLGWLLFLTSNLMAQNNEGRFKLKEGDWFEVEAEINYTTSFNLSKKYIQNNQTVYLLHYQLLKQRPNNNQQYKISLDHRKIIKKYDGRLLGNDNYYPDYIENKNSPDIKREFIFEVNHEGKLLELVSVKNNGPIEIKYSEIRPPINGYGTMGYSEVNSDSLLISIFSQVLLQKDTTSDSNNKFILRNGIPIIIKQKDIQLTLTDASFRLPPNALIFGKLKDQTNQDITISLNGENSDYYFQEKRFKTKNDGSFECPVFIKRPLHLKISIGNKALTTFMEPFDSLNINAIGHQAREIQYNQYAETKPNEYYSAGKDKFNYFSGSAAYNTMLSNELDQYRNGFVYEKELPEVLKKEKETKQAVNQLIESYRGKASDKCIEYFQSDIQYFWAVAKLYYKQEQEIGSFDAHGKYIRPSKVAYPSDFYMEVDTLPLLMNPFEWNTSYQNFIEMAQIFKQKRLGMSVRKTSTENFMENYYFNLASLKGYPLYLQLAYYLDMELKKGADIKTLQPYYYSFLNNCTDPALVEPLKNTYEVAAKLTPGSIFPSQLFKLSDGKTLSLEDHKGKASFVYISRLVMDFSPYLDAVKTINPEDMEFVFMFGNHEDHKDRIHKTGLDALPNVKILYVDEKCFDVITEDLAGRSFTLDKWLRIVDTNIPNLQTSKGEPIEKQFNEILRKAIDAKRYSKAEKSAFLKTAGWSLGSILFTLLAGFGIYRMRIRQIKQQEQARRRIKELEIKAIRSQMNPHFIFNALNSIQSLINGNQFKEANIYLSKFAVLLRGVLNNSEKSRVSLSDELKAVELYCQLEQLRFDFHFDITIAEDVNDDLIEIPGMIIQPLAENAVVHGISGKGNEGKLNIQVSRQNGHVCIGVEDNGVGLTAQAKDTLSQKGFGLKLVEERINILNLEGKEARLTVRNLENNSGTLATLIIPID